MRIESRVGSSHNICWEPWKAGLVSVVVVRSFPVKSECTEDAE